MRGAHSLPQGEKPSQGGHQGGRRAPTRLTYPCKHAAQIRTRAQGCRTLARHQTSNQNSKRDTTVTAPEPLQETLVMCMGPEPSRILALLASSPEGRPISRQATTTSACPKPSEHTVPQTPPCNTCSRPVVALGPPMRRMGMIDSAAGEERGHAGESHSRTILCNRSTTEYETAEGRPGTPRGPGFPSLTRVHACGAGRGTGPAYPRAPGGREGRPATTASLLTSSGIWVVWSPRRW